MYGHAARLRRRWFERRPDLRRALGRPVLSVGNISVGGTGKTPLVAELAKWLVARGERPAIISRGYARRMRQDGVVVVSDARRVLASLDESGDEPLLLARGVPGAAVLVSEDRVLAGRLAEHHLGCTVHLLDDGFQQVTVRKDLDILVTSPGEITGGRVLPAGRLREPADAAARADVVVVVGADEAGARSEAWALGVSQALGARRVVGAPLAGSVSRAQPVIAIAGLGNPAQFFEALRGQGWMLEKTLAFPDHHRYTGADLHRVATLAEASSAAAVITTEKDAVRLEPLGRLPFTLAVVPLTLAFDRWETLESAVAAALERFRARESAGAAWPPLDALPSREGRS